MYLKVNDMKYSDWISKLFHLNPCHEVHLMIQLSKQHNENFQPNGQFHELLEIIIG
mgnify:CR=1 FL=1